MVVMCPITHWTHDCCACLTCQDEYVSFSLTVGPCPTLFQRVVRPIHIVVQPSCCAMAVCRASKVYCAPLNRVIGLVAQQSLTVQCSTVTDQLVHCSEHVSSQGHRTAVLATG